MLEKEGFLQNIEKIFEKVKSKLCKSCASEGTEIMLEKEKLVQNIEKIFEKVKKETTVSMYRFSLLSEEPTIYDSCVGGVGYVPQNEDIPMDSKGNQLRLLAQINCEDIDLEEFPNAGILQFWILHDELAGLYDDFKVVYHEKIDKAVTKQDVLSKFKPTLEDFNPVKGEGYKISFKKSFDYGGKKFYDAFVKYYNEIYSQNPIKYFGEIPISYNELHKLVDGKVFNQNMGHKVGGFPGFIQSDPRECDDTHDYLLFQLDSDFDGLSFQDDFKERVMWGDSGIGNFFINKEKLKAKDFSDVRYHWDCG